MEKEYVGYDGTRMKMPTWLTDDERARAVIVAVHGLESHGRNLKNIGEYFSERGIPVFAPDLRGFGKFPGRKGHIVRFQEFIEDLHNIIMQVRDLYSKHIVYVYGHSLGGLIAIHYAGEYSKSIDGMILSSPAVSQTLDVGIATRIGGELMSALNIKHYIEGNIEIKYTSHDPDVIKHHEDDPLRQNKITPRLGIESLRAIKKGNRLAEEITLPVAILQAEDDKFVDPEKTREFYELLASPDKTFFLYEGFFHELHNEIGKERVFQDVEGWLEKRLPS